MANQKGYIHIVIVVLISLMAIGLVGGAWYYEDNREVGLSVVVQSADDVDTSINLNINNDIDNSNWLADESNGVSNVNTVVTTNSTQENVNIDVTNVESQSKCNGLTETECRAQPECLPIGCSCKTDLERFVRCDIEQGDDCDCHPDKFEYCGDLDCDNVQLYNGTVFIDCEEDYDCKFADTLLDLSLSQNRCKFECTNYSDEKYQAVSKNSYLDYARYTRMQNLLLADPCTLNDLNSCPRIVSEYIPSCVDKKCVKELNPNIDIDNLKWKTVEYKKDGYFFSFKVPDEWQQSYKMHTPTERDSLVTIDSPRDIIINVVFFNNDEASLEVWATKHKDHLQNDEGFHNWLKGISMSSAIVNDKEGYLYDLVYQRASYQDFHGRYLNLILENEEVVYRLSIGGGYNTFGQYLNIIDEVIESFKVIEEEL